MRMWLVDPGLMCNQHLLGEHVEMHMFVGAIRKGTSLRGYIEGGLVEVERIRERHDRLANEMMLRGMNHNSPILPVEQTGGRVDPVASLAELRRRCAKCAGRGRESNQ